MITNIFQLLKFTHHCITGADH